jgi:hypothetical protein
MAGFRVVNRPITLPADLGIVERSYNQLEQGHQNTIAAASKYKTVLAQLDLAPEEDAWRQQQIAKVDSALNNNMLYGNAYTAMDDVNKAIGDIESDPGMIGRLRAQKSFKEWNTKLDQANLTEQQRNYYREVNKYHYEDIKDANGNVIGGTDWKPSDNFVDSVDRSKLMQAALQIVAKDAGGGNQIYYMDANGNFTTDFSQSYDKMPYLNIAGKYEKVTKEKLQAALQTVIANTPGAQASLDQDYKIDMYYHNKDNKGGIDAVTDSKGVLLNKEQYLQKAFDPFFTSATYSHYYSQVSPLADMSAAAYKAKLTAKKKSGDSLYDALAMSRATTPGVYYLDKYASASGAIAKHKAASDILNNIANSVGVQFDPSNVQGSYQAIINKYKSQGGVIPKEVYDAYNEYSESLNQYNQLTSGITDKKEKDKIDAITAIENGVDLTSLVNNGNDYAKQYVNLINETYGTNDELVIPINNKTDLTNILNALSTNGLLNGYKEYGVEVRYDQDGNPQIVLPKQYSNNLAIVSEAIKNNSSPKYKMSYIPIYGQFEPTIDGDSYPYIINRIGNFYDNLSKEVDKLAISSQSVPIPTELVSNKDLIVTMAQNAVESGEYPEINAATKWAESAVNAVFNSGQGHLLQMMISYNGTPAAPANPDESATIKKAALSAAQKIRNNGKGVVSLSYDKNTGKQVIRVMPSYDDWNTPDVARELRAAGVDKDMTDYTMVIDNLTNNEYKYKVLNSPQMKNSTAFYNSVNAGVTQFDIFNNGQLINMGDGSFVYQDGTDLFPTTLTYKEARDIYTKNKLYQDLVYNYAMMTDADGNMSAANLAYFNSIVRNMAETISTDKTESDINFKFNSIIRSIQEDAKALK